MGHVSSTQAITRQINTLTNLIETQAPARIQAITDQIRTLSKEIHRLTSRKRHCKQDCEQGESARHRRFISRCDDIENPDEYDDCVADAIEDCIEECDIEAFEEDDRIEQMRDQIEQFREHIEQIQQDRANFIVERDQLIAQRNHLRFRMRSRRAGGGNHKRRHARRRTRKFSRAK